MIEPVARVAIRRLATRGPTVGIERELVMSHRGLVTMRALWLDGRVRDRLSGRRKHGRTACHQGNDREESRHAFHFVQPSMATFKASLAEGGAARRAKLISEHLLPERDLGERRQQMISERAFFAPRISTSD